jgi:hypothetical protein
VKTDFNPAAAVEEGDARYKNEKAAGKNRANDAAQAAQSEQVTQTENAQKTGPYRVNEKEKDKAASFYQRIQLDTAELVPLTDPNVLTKGDVKKLMDKLQAENPDKYSQAMREAKDRVDVMKMQMPSEMKKEIAKTMGVRVTEKSNEFTVSENIYKKGVDNVVKANRYADKLNVPDANKAGNAADYQMQ